MGQVGRAFGLESREFIGLSARLSAFASKYQRTDLQALINLFLNDSFSESTD